MIASYLTPDVITYSKYDRNLSIDILTFVINMPLDY